MNFNEFITVNKKAEKPIYEQVADCLIDAIKKGVLQPGTRLPGAKRLAQTLGLYTKTLEKAYEELYAQNWVTIKANSGTYIAINLPVQNLIKLPNGKKRTGNKAFFEFQKLDMPINSPSIRESNFTYNIILNDGYPDIQLMPAVELEKNYRLILNRKRPGKVLDKGNPWGLYDLRQSLCEFLNNTRGLNINPSNILISKGNQFSIFLILSLTLKKGDVIAIAEINYLGVYNICKYLNLDVEFVRLDGDGINLNDLHTLCKHKKISSVYITPHLHYPTGAKLSLDRRTRLLELAEEYNFFIIEDDYDFDFHFKNSPTLPIASVDKLQRVIYVGGFNRLLSATNKVSYIVGPEDFLSELAKLKISIDKFSDIVMEEALSLTFKGQSVIRYRNKATKYYHQQCEYFCSLIDKDLSKYCTYIKPEGGMAVWLEFNQNIQIDNLTDTCKRMGLYLPERNSLFIYPPNSNGIRIGFASTSKTELSSAVSTMKSAIDKILSGP
jgi:GntR family transcriptional regulator / MocR family aminotransferase